MVVERQTSTSSAEPIYIKLINQSVSYRDFMVIVFINLLRYAVSFGSHFSPALMAIGNLFSSGLSGQT